MKAYANVGKLQSGRYVSQVLVLLSNGDRIVASTLAPRSSRNHAARDGFALRSYLHTVTQDWQSIGARTPRVYDDRDSASYDSPQSSCYA